MRRRRVPQLREAVPVENRVQVHVGRTRVDRRGGCDQPLMIEERAAERGLEEVIQDRVVRMTPAVQVPVDRQLLGVVIPHHETACVAPGHVLVLRTAVDLVLLLIEPVHRDADATGLRNVLRQVERTVGDPVGEPWIRDGRRLRVVDRARQGRVRGSGTVGLPRGRTRAVDPVRTREEAVQRVEAAVLLEDHDDVLDPLDPRCR